MFQKVFIRNIQAGDSLDIFFVSAISSLLLLRFALYLAGYPQVGGGSLHIAHMLYGGLLMMAAIVLLVSFIGRRVQRLAALVGGIGFGIFIDELGKFITKDNNYFFKPTIGIIYALFIILYLVFSFLGRRRQLSSREYQLNALSQFEEAVLHDLDNIERHHIGELLERADKNSPITQELSRLLTHIKTVPISPPNRLARTLKHFDRQYSWFWKRRASNQLVSALFIVEAIVFLVAVFATLFNNFDTIQDVLVGGHSQGQTLIIGQLISSIFAATFAVYGVVQLPSSRLNAYEQFRRATLINIFLTEFFIFSRIQFGVIASFVANIVILLSLRYAIYQETRLRSARVELA